MGGTVGVESTPGSLTVFTVRLAVRPASPSPPDNKVRPVVTYDDVLRARESISGRVHRTPTFSSEAISERTGARVYLKAELFQRTGSFKPRGVLAKLGSPTEEEKQRGVVTWSAGNAARRSPSAPRPRGRPAASSCGGRPTRSRSRRPVATAPRSTRRRTPRPRRTTAARPRRGDRRDLRAPVRRPGAACRPRHARHRGARGRFGARCGRRSRRGRRSDLRRRHGREGQAPTGTRDRRRAGGAAALYDALATGHVVQVTPQSVADGLAAPFTGEYRRSNN